MKNKAITNEDFLIVLPILNETLVLVAAGGDKDRVRAFERARDCVAMQAARDLGGESVNERMFGMGKIEALEELKRIVELQYQKDPNRYGSLKGVISICEASIAAFREELGVK